MFVPWFELKLIVENWSMAIPASYEFIGNCTRVNIKMSEHHNLNKKCKKMANLECVIMNPHFSQTKTKEKTD